MEQWQQLLPQQVNEGPFLTSYTLPELQSRIKYQCPVLPICSLGTPVESLAELGPLVLPPLYHEALTPDLKRSLIERIGQCFPYYEGTRARGALESDLVVVEMPVKEYEAPCTGRVVCFSVDTAVEEHGPHLPLATDTIQSYAVLDQMRLRYPQIYIAPPVEYGHLTWGLPFGMSIDITPSLLVQYVAHFTDAIMKWLNPYGIYVVDVHGSTVHRNAIQEGLRISSCDHYRFRWLHEPLIQFAGERGDQHAGGVETALVEWVSPGLVDNRIWPEKAVEIARGEMYMDHANELSEDLGAFISEVEQSQDSKNPLNGVVGVINNYEEVDAQDMMQRMWVVASRDIEELIE